jgi:hypothetical protein
VKCNHDCFHCKYPDCTLPGEIITKWENDVMKGAHGRWDFENKLQRYLKMKSAGWSQIRIKMALDTSNYMIHKIKKTAIRRASEKRLL